MNTSKIFFHRSPRRPVGNSIFILFSVLTSPTQQNLAVAAATDEKLLVITQASTELAKPPFLVSWCEGKNCEHQFSKQAICKSSLYTDARTDSKKVGELVIGQDVDTRNYFTKILKLGSYLPLEGASRVLVSRADEHSWVSFFDHAWDSENDVTDHAVFPLTESWAFVKTKMGVSGFVKIENVGGKTCPFAKAARGDGGKLDK
jgi:hypothetical protein